MRKRKVRIFTAVLFILVLTLSAGCGETAQPVTEPEPVSTPEPTPTPTPTPVPEPELPAGDSVTVDGVELKSGSVQKSGAAYVKLNEAAEAMSLTLDTTEEGAVSFLWRDKTVRLERDSACLTLDGEAKELASPVIKYREELWIPIESVCQALDISLFYDEEFSHLYCTPEAGNWELPEGYSVPVLMYHAVSDYIRGSAELYSSPSQVEEQISWLLENGFDLIWFSDLEHVDEYDKPIILTFDDGYTNNYTDLFPILQKYNAKATFFVVTAFVHGNDSGYMNEEQVKEVAASGLVSIQSHTYSHPELSRLSSRDQEFQLAQSKLDIIRMTGKEPFVLCYPRGNESSITRGLLTEYYRFGVKMSGREYCTGDDPALIYRYYIKRGYGAAKFEALFG